MFSTLNEILPTGSVLICNTDEDGYYSLKIMYKAREILHITGTDWDSAAKDAIKWFAQETILTVFNEQITRETKQEGV